MALATVEDVAARLGRDLTEAETTMAEQVIEDVTGEIADFSELTVAYLDGLDPAPRVLRAICVDKVVALGANPQGLAAHSETLGQHTESKTFQRGSGGESGGGYLTDADRRRIRRALGIQHRSATLATPYSGDDSSSLEFAEFSEP